MATTSASDRDWIGAELVKCIDAERSLATNAKARADSPPEPALGVLYSEIASADERHSASFEIIATRYGHTPARSVAGGVTETLGRLKDRVVGIGSSSIDCLRSDLQAKADAIHWYTAWIRAFEAIGDTESARELGVILSEEQTHQQALQQGLDRMVGQRARGETA